ncbi:hypothetical protein, partial [Escherichia coli]|uniref:hypothetical protein n=1 Tax=Escherichia coli TaxID=562 RepID=UPI000D49165D
IERAELVGSRAGGLSNEHRHMQKRQVIALTGHAMDGQTETMRGEGMCDCFFFRMCIRDRDRTFICVWQKFKDESAN